MNASVYRCQVAIIDEQDRLLLIRHQHHADLHTYWLLPGGGLEIGETDEQCAAREAFEETGLQVRVERLLLETPAESPGYYSSYKTFLCTPLSGEPAPGYEPEPEAAAKYAIVEMAWFDLNDETYWGDLVRNDQITYPLLKQIQHSLNKPGNAKTHEK